MASDVRTTLGANIRRIRKLRELTGQALINRLSECGVKLLPSGLSDLENGRRKLTVEELLALAIVLNTSIIDLLTPADGSALKVAEAVEPLLPVWLERWLSGETPWPPDLGSEDYTKAFFDTASETRRMQNRIATRPELQEIAALRSAVVGAVEGPGTWVNQIDDPKLMAQLMRDTLSRVNAYVNLLADKIEKNGYGG